MTMNRRQTVTAAAAAALSALLPEVTTATPLPELTTHAGDTYDLAVWLTVATERYPGGTIAAGESTLQSYCVEAGRDGRGWNLRVSPWSGTVEDGDVSGPPVVDVRDQSGDTDPLTLLRALLTGAIV